MKRIAIRFGILMFFGLVAYFLLMRVAGLVENFQFRIFNGVIHMTFIYLAIKAYLKQLPDEWNYLSAVAMGVVTSAVGVVLFAIFQIFYLVLNPGFMQFLQENVESVGQYLTPGTSALIILVEGLAVSVIGSYLVMRVLDASVRKKKAYGGSK